MCDCLDTVQANLRTRGIRVVATAPLAAGAELLPPRPTISTEWVRLGREYAPPTLIAICCPFCGQPYASAETADAQEPRQ